MTRAFTSLLFSRLLASVLGANYLSFVVLNATNANVYLTPILYLIFFAGLFYLSKKIKPRKFSAPIDLISLAMMGCLFLLLILSRLPYIFDWLPNMLCLLPHDDYARLPEVLAMTANEKYPLMSPSNAMYPFSFYYTSLYPFAVFKLLIPFLTIKEGLAIVHALYYGLIIFSLYEVACITLRDQSKIRTLIFLCTLFGGFDWLMKSRFASPTLFELSGHAERWQESFGVNASIQSIFNNLMWAIHHFIGAYSAILAYVFLFKVRITSKYPLKILLVSILLLSSFYSSPFAFLSVSLFILLHYRLIWRRFINPYTIVLAASALIPLSIFMNKFPGPSFAPGGFTMRFPIADEFRLTPFISLFAFFFLVSIIDFAGIPFLLMSAWRKLCRMDKRYFITACLFIISTYFVVYSGDKNYSMRGAIIPSFVFFWLFAKHSTSCLVCFNFIPKTIRWVLFSLIIIAASYGTLKEASGRIKEVNSYCGYRLQLEKDWKPNNLYLISTTSSIKTLTFAEAMKNVNDQRLQVYMSEKFISDLPLEQMTRQESELIRKPFDGEHKE
jgi:hypothetical protein